MAASAVLKKGRGRSLVAVCSTVALTGTSSINAALKSAKRLINDRFDQHRFLPLVPEKPILLQSRAFPGLPPDAESLIVRIKGIPTHNLREKLVAGRAKCESTIETVRPLAEILIFRNQLIHEIRNPKGIIFFLENEPSSQSQRSCSVLSH